MKPKNWDEVLKAYVAHPDYGMLQFGKFLKDKYPNGISFNDSGEGDNQDDAMNFAIWIHGYENLTQCKKFWHVETTKELYDHYKSNLEKWRSQ